MQVLLKSAMAACALAWTTHAPAAELMLHAGALQGTHVSGGTYAWGLEYQRQVAEHFSAGFIWYNEGHVSDHHRDGQAVQLWWHTAMRPRMTLEAGLGPYRFHDTDSSAGNPVHENEHGWGVLASVGLKWYAGQNWFGSLRLNRVQSWDDFNTTSVTAGLGYRFDNNDGAQPASHGWINVADNPAGPWEFDLMAGRAIANNIASEKRLASAIALRYRATPHLSGSLSLIDEGQAWNDVDGRHRRGIAPQIWLEDDLGERLSVGAGIGPYFLISRPTLPSGERFSSVSTLFSVTAAYALTPQWLARVMWNRVSTSYHRDADVVLLTLGYRF